MRQLGDFAVGTKVYVPDAVDHGYESRYSTILYSDEEIVLLKPEYGEAFIQPADRDDFELFGAASAETLEKLGTDLMWAIENACWRDEGRNNLSGPTPHMISAVDNWKRRHNV